MRKVKIAHIGMNLYSHAKYILKSVQMQEDLFELVGYVLPENERERLPDQVKLLEGLQELTLEEVFNNPEIEAVAIETDEIYLTKYALMAAKAGKHIHMEKPGGIMLNEFEELISIMKETKKVLHIGYMYRYNPYIIELFDQVRKGDLGEIISVEAQMNCIHPKEARQWLSSFPGGMMFFLGCHLVDLVLQIQGTPDKVIPFNKSTGCDGVTSEDFGMALFEYKNGVSFVKTNASEIGGYARRQLVVNGTKGTVEIKPLEINCGPSLVRTGKTEYQSKEWSNQGIYSETDNFERYDSMMTAFAAMVRGEKENPYSYDYELELYKTVLEACGGKKDV